MMKVKLKANMTLAAVSLYNTNSLRDKILVSN